jgi:hypothetical protein
VTERRDTAKTAMRHSGVPNYVLTEHALFEMRRRGLSGDAVRQVLASPEQRFDVRPGRVVLQSRITMGMPGKRYLVRVVADVDREPAEVVTVYRTSKIDRYWREEL